MALYTIMIDFTQVKRIKFFYHVNSSIKYNQNKIYREIFESITKSHVNK